MKWDEALDYQITMHQLDLDLRELLSQKLLGVVETKHKKTKQNLSSLHSTFFIHLFWHCTDTQSYRSGLSSPGLNWKAHKLVLEMLRERLTKRPLLST